MVTQISSGLLYLTAVEKQKILSTSQVVHMNVYSVSLCTMFSVDIYMWRFIVLTLNICEGDDQVNVNVHPLAIQGK